MQSTFNIKKNIHKHNFKIVIGRPTPNIRWLVNGILVDDEYEKNFGNVIENRLIWTTVRRQNLHSIFTCQAMNTHLMEPREKSYVLDMYCK